MEGIRKIGTKKNWDRHLFIKKVASPHFSKRKEVNIGCS